MINSRSCSPSFPNVCEPSCSSCTLLVAELAKQRSCVGIKSTGKSASCALKVRKQRTPRRKQSQCTGELSSSLKRFQRATEEESFFQSAASLRRGRTLVFALDWER